MKSKNIVSRAGSLLILAGALLLPSFAANAATAAPDPYAGTALGGFGFTNRWAVFTVGQDDHPKGMQGMMGFQGGNIQVNNRSNISGNVGDGGNISIQINNYSSTGPLFVNSQLPPPNIQISNGSTAGGLFYVPLNQDVAAAHAAEAFYANQQANAVEGVTFVADPAHEKGFSTSQIKLNNETLVLTANPATPELVFKLSTFTLNNNSTLDIQGSTNQKIVFDVYGNFSVNNHSSIDLSGGLTAANVVFNIVGNGGGNILNNNSTIHGTILALQSEVQMNNGSNAVVGSVISGGLQLNNRSIISQED